MSPAFFASGDARLERRFFLVLERSCRTSRRPPPRATRRSRSCRRSAGAPEVGKTRVVVDANGDKATVNEVTAWSHGTAWGGGGFVSGHAETVKPLCIAPCVVDLEPRVHVLRFIDDRDHERSGEARIQLGEKPKLVRHAMGRTISHNGAEATSLLLIALGASAVATGGTMLGVGSLRDEKDDGMVLGSAITLGVGATMLLLGIPMAVASQTHVQEGTTTEKTLDR